MVNLHLDEIKQLIKLHAIEMVGETAKKEPEAAEFTKRLARLTTMVDEYRRVTKPRLADTQQIDMGLTGCL